MKVAKDMIPADLAIVPFVSIKGNYITKIAITLGIVSGEHLGGSIINVVKISLFTLKFIRVHSP